MNGDKIDDVPRNTAARCRGSFVRGEIGRMQDKSEQFIGLRRKEAKIGICGPFELGPVATPADNRGVQARTPTVKPIQFVSGILNQRRIRSGHRGKPFVTVVENIDVTGKPRTVPVERDCSGNVTVRIALRCEKAQQLRLEPAKRHGTIVRCVRPDGVPPCGRACAGLA